ncbi:predicted protein [Arabidopsis lyrata subsp. lyrata]|uniref:Predicted protein n=1 Tax=Arabidopsis lyrata subsp. lyrata TaxID=81972 RepID=D7MHH9_ARALL|nr:predicted protein [Arabidopsis lyrata subsp. lyrata]
MVRINPIVFSGNTVLVVDESNKSKSGDNKDEGGNSGLEKIEDGAVGKLEPAERLFGSVIQEAKEGFGEKDPHVAPACNNLVGLGGLFSAFIVPWIIVSYQHLEYSPRTNCSIFSFLYVRDRYIESRKNSTKQSPYTLYLEVVSILEDFYGPEDVR